MRMLFTDKETKTNIFGSSSSFVPLLMPVFVGLTITSNWKKESKLRVHNSSFTCAVGISSEIFFGWNGWGAGMWWKWARKKTKHKTYTVPNVVLRNHATQSMMWKLVGSKAILIVYLRFVIWDEIKDAARCVILNVDSWDQYQIWWTKIRNSQKLEYSEN